MTIYLVRHSTIRDAFELRYYWESAWNTYFGHSVAWVPKGLFTAEEGR